MLRSVRTKIFVSCLTLTLALGFHALAQDSVKLSAAFENPIVTSEMITLPTMGDFESFKLTVKGPENYHFEMEFSGENVPFIDTYNANGQLLADGIYAFQLKATPKLSADVKDAMRFARATGDMAEVDAMRKTGIMPVFPEPAYGYFSISQGQFIVPGEETLIAAKNEGRNPGEKPGDPVKGDEVVTVDGPVGVDDSDLGDRAQVIATDLVVQGSACVGFDCVNGESFGFDTLRLKENNLRIHFQDTSVSASFPSTDWRLAANDTTNGGANRFSIEDATAGRTPFTIEGSAPSHSLYVDDGGRIGVGTNTPVVEIHVADGDTPTLRLEQDGTSGFTPQAWDVAGNETNWFVRDATNGSPLPLRIKPRAPQNSLYIDADGDIGMGSQAPDAELHVEGGNGTATALVTANGADGLPQFKALYEGTTSLRREMFFVSNYGEPSFRFNNSEAGQDWSMILLSSDTFIINRNGVAGEEFSLTSTGNLTILGTLAENSDVNAKENFEEVDPLQVLDQVNDLQITTWNYIDDEDSVRHMGPMAQDFAAAFGLGNANTSIHGMDVRGVVIAAIQGLNQRIDEKEADLSEKDQTILDLQKENAELNQRLQNLEVNEVDALKKRLATLEAMIQGMAKDSK